MYEFQRSGDGPKSLVVEQAAALREDVCPSFCAATVPTGGFGLAALLCSSLLRY